MSNETPPIVLVLRTGAVAAGVVGRIMLPVQFWLGVVCIYVGLLAAIVDLWFETGLRGKPVWRIVGSVVVGLFIYGFSQYLVFVDAPLDVSGSQTDGEYPMGTAISGIQWRKEFTELNIEMVNPTDRVYEDLNLVIRPTEPVVAVEQISRFPGISFEDKNDLTTHLLDIPRQGDSKAIPLDLLATDAGYRMRCPRLPAHSTIKIEMALANIIWNPARPGNAPPEESVRELDYVLQIKGDDFSTYWMGHKEADVYTPRPSIQWFKIEGDYVVLLRKRKVSKKVNVAGKINVKWQ
jgi:hypothetical protein